MKSLLLLTAAFSAVLARPSGSSDASTSADVVTGKLGNATVVKNNPEDAAFRMVFPKKQFFPTAGGPIKGVVVAQTSEGGAGVTYNIKFENLPSEGGPFIYHIHQKTVPDDGNCTDTAAHLDPFDRGETPPCNPDLPQTCQVGDLAGKHGAIVTNKDTTSFSTTYTDPFTATGDGKSFIGNLSMVLHFANVTRITCGNFAKMEDDDDDDNVMSSLDDILNTADSLVP